ncbi:MAG TPA: hypothetical protein VNA20_08075 [Frankiaceae bacterium]|nr:hypothetical protein [Frankiaceae bacterium]
MRLQLSLATAATVGAAAVAVAFSAPAASARPCPDGTKFGPIATVGGHTVYGCVLYPQPCDLTCEPPPTTPPAPRP